MSFASFTQDEVNKFSALLVTLENTWQTEKPVVTGWLSKLVPSPAVMQAAFKFLFGGVNQLVQLAQTFVVPGADKKAIVLAFANQLFAKVISVEIPLPFQPAILAVQPIFDAMVNAAIEFCVTLLPTPAPAPVVPAK